jgi:hypothetical protein
MVLASARLRGIPLDKRHFEYYQRDEFLSNVHWLGLWCQHFDDELRLCQNYWKIIGKTKKSGIGTTYSVTLMRPTLLFYSV